MIFEISPELTEDIHRLSLKLEIAMRKLVEENNLDAFTMNFSGADWPGSGHTVYGNQ